MSGRLILWFKNILCVAGTLGLLVVGFAACGQQTSTSSGPINIGVSLSLSGDF